jgi:hypothetical protein
LCLLNCALDSIGRGKRGSQTPKRWKNLCREFIMSARNGDKSRFHRERKQKIARRKRTQELLERAAKAGKAVEKAPGGQRRSVSA